MAAVTVRVSCYNLENGEKGHLSEPASLYYLLSLWGPIYLLAQHSARKGHPSSVSLAESCAPRRLTRGECLRVPAALRNTSHSTRAAPGETQKYILRFKKDAPSPLPLPHAHPTAAIPFPLHHLAPRRAPASTEEHPGRPYRPQRPAGPRLAAGESRRVRVLGRATQTRDVPSAFPTPSRLCSGA